MSYRSLICSWVFLSDLDSISIRLRVINCLIILKDLIIATHTHKGGATTIAGNYIHCHMTSSVVT